jgi:hypothetical protein
LTKKTFDLILIEVVLVGTAFKLFKLWASREASESNEGFVTQVAEAVIGL